MAKRALDASKAPDRSALLRQFLCYTDCIRGHIFSAHTVVGTGAPCRRRVLGPLLLSARARLVRKEEDFKFCLAWSPLRSESPSLPSQTHASSLMKGKKTKKEKEKILLLSLLVLLFMPPGSLRAQLRHKCKCERAELAHTMQWGSLIFQSIRSGLHIGCTGYEPWTSSSASPPKFSVRLFR